MSNRVPFYCQAGGCESQCINCADEGPDAAPQGNKADVDACAHPVFHPPIRESGGLPNNPAVAAPDEAVKLGVAIAEAAKRAGFYNGDGVLDGPLLLLLLNDMADVLEDRHRLVRELDEALSGPGNFAKQASLCDLIPLAKNMRLDIGSLERELAALSRIVTKLGEELHEAQRQRAEYRERAYEAEGALSDPVLGFDGEEIEEEDGFGPAVNKP